MMNNQPNQQAGKKGSAKEFLLRFWKIISHQWGMKLICILLAVFMWGMLITQDTSLTREKEFTDVEINVVNASALQRSGYIVVSGLENLETVDITAQIPQKYYDDAAPSNYSIRVDLSTIKGTGEQTLKIESSKHSLYGSVTEISLKEITVVVDEYVTRSRIPVKVNTFGELPEGVYANAGNAAVDPEYVTVAGPKSIVSTVVRCVAQYDMSAVSGQVGLERTACAFVLEDVSRNAVDLSKLTVMVNNVEVDSIVVEQNMYPQVEQTVSQDDLVTGQVAEGYQVKSVTVMPQSVLVAVRDQSTFVNETAYLDGKVDVTGLTESTTVVLPIHRPDDVIDMNTDIVYVTVEIVKTQAAEGTT